MAQVLPVLVVGAGPTGCTVALLLARLGIACTVVDRHRDIHPLPRAVHLDDEAVRILQHAGIADGFAAISRPAAGLRLLDARLRPFAEFRRDRSAGEHGHPEANLFDQPDLERLLRARLHREPLVTLRGGVDVVAVEQVGSGPARVTLQGSGPPEHVRAEFVLGCDGAGSTVRDAISARLRDLRFTERWFVLDVRSRRPIPGWGGVDQICDPHRAATFVPLPGDRYRWEFRMRAGETVVELARPGRLAELTDPWGVRPDELEVLRAAGYVFRARIADRWRDRRVLLLGDAAHLTPPFIGQGLGAGLRDAHNLAWKLAAVLGGASEALLESYQAERAPHAEAMIRGAVRIGRAMTGGQDVVAALRRPVTALLLRVPGVRAAALRGIATRHPAGPLVDRRRHRRDPVGTFCPQPPVGLDGRRVLFDDVLGEGYALLATGPPPPALLHRARLLRARTVHLASGCGPADDTVPDVTVSDDDGVLRAWLRRGGVSAVLLRPDRIVTATAAAERSSP